MALLTGFVNQLGYFAAKLALAGLASVLPAHATAQTTTYSYDAQGRLIGAVVTRAGGAVTTTIAHDQAGNRKRYTVFGSASGTAGGSDTGGGASVPSPPSAGAAAMRLVVVPLNGFTVIPIG